MANVKLAYGSQVAMTVTNLQSLASAASSPYTAWMSASVDNTSNLYEDYEVEVTLAQATSGTPSGDLAAYVYAYALDTSFVEGSGEVTGSEGLLSSAFIEPTNLRLLGVVQMPSVNKTYKRRFNLAAAFGGIVPPQWGLVVRQYTGLTLQSSGNGVSYRGIYHTVT